jgi:hypothetical protein
MNSSLVMTGSRQRTASFPRTLFKRPGEGLAKIERGKVVDPLKPVQYPHDGAFHLLYADTDPVNTAPVGTAENIDQSGVGCLADTGHVASRNNVGPL